jgi:hypothetical protein
MLPLRAGIQNHQEPGTQNMALLSNILCPFAATGILITRADASRLLKNYAEDHF